MKKELIKLKDEIIAHIVELHIFVEIFLCCYAPVFILLIVLGALDKMDIPFKWLVIIPLIISLCIYLLATYEAISSWYRRNVIFNPKWKHLKKKQK